VLIAGLAVAGVKIKDALHKSDAVQSEANRLSKLSEGGLGSSYLIEKTCASVLQAVRTRIGSQAPMLEVSVGPTAVQFQYATGNRAAGLTANTVQPALAPEQVTLTGSGSVKAASFPLTEVRESVPAQFAPKIRRIPGLSDFTLTNATLHRQPLDHHVGWTVVGTGGGRQLVFGARPNGTGLRRIS
jgi:hypothetical protein